MPSNIGAKLEAIKGESLDSKHKDEIDVLSFSWGLVNTAPRAGRGGGASGEPTFHDIAFVHNIDRASPLLMRPAPRARTSRRLPSRAAKRVNSSTSN